jgi:hypothetical protein
MKQETKSNLKEKLKSLPMWAGVVASGILAIGIDWTTLTSWTILKDTVINFLNNPAAIILFIVTIYASLNNPNNRNGF